MAEALQQLWPDTFPSASSAKKTLSKRCSPILVNDERPKKCQMVKLGDTVTRKPTKALVVSRGDVTLDTVVASTGPLVLAYLDSAVAVIVKPHGMAVTGSATSEDCLYQKLLFCLPPATSSAAEPLRRPCPCHRIDKPTYGLLVVARTKEAARRVCAAFEERRVQKRYRAIVHGELGSGGTDDDDSASGHIKKDLSGKECHSEWRVVGKSWEVVGSGDREGGAGGVRLTCVDLIPHTGRVHQLRRHMKHIGHPIVGDTRYGHEGTDRRLLRSVVSEAGKDWTEKQNTRGGAANGNGMNEGSDSSLPLMLAAVEIQFPHKVDESIISSGERGKGCILDVSCTTTSDEEQLKVAIDMPQAMKNLIK